MNITVSSEEPAKIAADWLVLLVAEQQPFDQTVESIDRASGGVLRRLWDAEDFTGKPAAIIPVRGIAGLGTPRVLLVGVGPLESLTLATLDKALMAGFRTISDKPDRRVAVVVPTAIGEKLSRGDWTTAVTVAGQVGSLGQDLFKATRTRHAFAELTILGGSNHTDALNEGIVIGEAVNLARDLVNRPPAEIKPVTFAARAEELAKAHGIACEIFDQPRLEAERMRSLLAVAQGSVEPPRMVQLTYNGGGADAPKLAFVGKGVTFDSGGLSLKPSDGMITMKCDMAGAAAVLAATVAVARLKLPVNVVGFMGLVENMPSGSAFKLGDILTARNGVTIEVLNTDAEGRLVLADVLSYAVDMGVDKIVDLATLTGACVVALGEDVAGAMTNDQPWCDAVLGASKDAAEDIWQLPMFPLFDELIKGDIGDIKNTGGRWGGAITAAKFLEKFVGEKPWVHLDIAGPAFASGNKPHREAGATGFGVKTLIELARRSATK